MFTSFLFPCLKAKHEEIMKHTSIELAKDIDLAEECSPSKKEARVDDDSSAGPMTMGKDCESAGCDHCEARSVNEVAVVVDDKHLMCHCQLPSTTLLQPRF
jgi:hypothetical protein